MGPKRQLEEQSKIESKAKEILKEMEREFDDALMSFDLKYDLRGKTYSELKNYGIKGNETKYQTELLYNDNPSEFDLQTYLIKSILTKVKGNEALKEIFREETEDEDIIRLLATSNIKISDFAAKKIKAIIHIIDFIKNAEALLSEIPNKKIIDTRYEKLGQILKIYKGLPDGENFDIKTVKGFLNDGKKLKGFNKGFPYYIRFLRGNQSNDRNDKIDSITEDFNPDIIADATVAADDALKNIIRAQNRLLYTSDYGIEKVKKIIEEAKKFISDKRAEFEPLYENIENTSITRFDKSINAKLAVAIAKEVEEKLKEVIDAAKTEAKQAEEAEEARQDEEAKQAEEARQAEEAKQAEEARIKDEEAKAVAAKEPVAELLTDFVVDILDRIRPQTSTSFDADGLLQIVASVEEKTSVSPNFDDLLQTISHVEEEPKTTLDGNGTEGTEGTEFGDLLQTISQVEEAVADFDSDFIIDMLDKIKPQISQHFEISDLLSVVADVEEEPYEPFILDGLFSMLADVEEDRPTLETDFIIDILDRIKPQVSQHFDIDGLLQIIPNIEEKDREPVDNLPDILATIADIREQPAKPFEIDGLLELLPNIEEKQSEPFEFSDLLQVISAVEEMVAEFDSDFIIDILDRIEPQLAKPIDFNGLLSVVSEVEEYDCERELKACKEENKRLLDELQRLKNRAFMGLNNKVGQFAEPIGDVERDGLGYPVDSWAPMGTMGPMGPGEEGYSDKGYNGVRLSPEYFGDTADAETASEEADFSGVLEVLSSINDEGQDGEGLKACKVIEYVNADGEKETLYPFALIQGRCYYYNKNHDILNDRLEIV